MNSNNGPPDQEAKTEIESGNRQLREAAAEIISIENKLKRKVKGVKDWSHRLGQIAFSAAIIAGMVITIRITSHLIHKSRDHRYSIG